MKSQKGFSLIELLVVMAIISILAAVGTIQYMKYIANSRYAKLESTLRQMMLVAEDYYSEFNKYPNGSCDNLSSGGEKVCWIDASGSVVTSSGSYSFKVPPFVKVQFTPKGSGSIQIYVESSSKILRNSSKTGNAKLVIDSTTPSNDIACYDDEIHGKNWSSVCPSP
jgi:prepilin-type N-terminal cleavage/methylation domain-containing protein